jgi:hypothetical protein
LIGIEIQTDSGPILVVVAGGKFVADTKATFGFGSAEAHWLKQGTPVKEGEQLPMLEVFAKKNL